MYQGKEDFLASGSKAINYLFTMEDYTNEWKEIAEYAEDEQEFQESKMIPIMKLKLLNDFLVKDKTLSDYDKERLTYTIEIIKAKIVLGRNTSALDGVNDVPEDFLEEYYATMQESINEMEESYGGKW